MRPIASATSFTLAGEPAATLKMRPLAPSACAARTVASTTLATYVKSRDCSPSPYTVTGLPAAMAVMKSGTIAAYCEKGL